MGLDEEKVSSVKYSTTLLKQSGMQEIADLIEVCSTPAVFNCKIRSIIYFYMFRVTIT